MNTITKEEIKEAISLHGEAINSERVEEMMIKENKKGEK